MPLDKYRNVGPSDAISLDQIHLLNDLPVSNHTMDCNGSPKIVTKQLSFLTGVSVQARGSAYVELNNTKVAAAVFGPMDPKRSEVPQPKAQLAVFYKLSPFATKDRNEYAPNSTEKRLASFVRDSLSPCIILDSLPKVRIEVHCLVLDEAVAGNALSVAITAAGLSLVDAGFMMYDMITASTATFDTDTQLWKPLTSGSKGSACLTVAYLPNLLQVAGVLLERSVLSSDDINKGYKHCIDQCKSLYTDLSHKYLSHLEWMIDEGLLVANDSSSSSSISGDKDQIGGEVSDGDQNMEVADTV